MSGRSALTWAGAVLLAAACAPESPRGSVLLITLDTTRADALSCYGNPRPTTPALDALAAEGVLFERAHTVTALTLPAHASLLTGLDPVRHGLRDNGVAALPEEARTVAEAAREAGFQTAAFLSSVVLDASFGLAQGFETYDTPPRRGRAESSSHGAERSARDTVDAALGWLARRDARRPFFLWVHVYDPHHPYAPPADLAGEWADAPYLGEVAAMDRELGRLLDTLRGEEQGWDRTFVLVVADHGEAFGEHGEVTHGTFCYEPTLHVPLIARWPGAAHAGRRSKALVGVVDVAPTLSEALGVAPLPAIDGRSFFAAPEREREGGLYFESYYPYLTYGWSPLSGWLDTRGKYVHSSEPELYDWIADPAEAHDLLHARPQPPGAERELERYRRAIAARAAQPALSPEARGLDAEMLAEIQSLGYAGGGEGLAALPHPLEDTGLPAPRTRAAFLARQAQAQERAAAGDLEGAAAIYAAELEATPSNHLAREELAGLRLRQGRVEEAVTLLRELATSGPERGRVWFGLGLALRQADQLAEAAQALARAVELTGGRRRYVEAWIETLETLGRDAEAAQARERFGRAP